MWKPIEIGPVVAERKLTFQRDDLQKSVTLVVGQPVRPDRADALDPWWCPIQLRGLDDRVHSIAGEDSLQALVLALESECYVARPLTPVVGVRHEVA